MNWIQDQLQAVRIDQWLVAYVVMALPVAVSGLYRLKLEGEIVRVSLRATAQLIFISLLLLPVFYSPWFVHVALILTMGVLGAFVARERGRDLPGALGTAMLGLSGSFVMVLAVFLVTGALDFQPNIVIPIAGMLIGNAGRTVSLHFHRTRKDFEAYQPMMEAMMLDGAAYREVLFFPSQETLRTALVPRIDSLKTLGIVHIPGAMAGMMVAGASPLEAAGYQILIFFGIVSTAALAGIVTNRRIYRVLFESTYPHLKIR